MSVVNVVAIITTKPGMRTNVLAAFNANVPAVRAENGCIEYAPTIDTEDVGPFQTKVGPDTFVVIEKWKSLEHLMTHAAAPHMVRNMLSASPDAMFPVTSCCIFFL